MNTQHTPTKITHYSRGRTDKMHFACGAHLMSRNTSDLARVNCPLCRAAIAKAEGQS